MGRLSPNLVKPQNVSKQLKKPRKKRKNQQFVNVTKNKVTKMNGQFNAEINCNSNLYSDNKIKVSITTKLSKSSNLLKMNDKIDFEFYGNGGLKMYTMTLEDLMKVFSFSDTEKIKPFTTFQR